jgi:uncharacterized protein
MKRRENNPINALARQIVDLVHPLRIILFGSHARGDARPDSDIDLLIIIRNRTNRRRVEETLCRKLRGHGVAFDVLVATESILAKYKDNIGLIYRTILDEGRDIYAA